MANEVELKVTRADIADVEVDLMILKFAQRFYGADEMIAYRLAKEGKLDAAAVQLEVDEAFEISTGGAIKPKKVMFLGTPGLARFRYGEMRKFAFRAIEIIDRSHPDVETIGLTVHGAGFML